MRQLVRRGTVTLSWVAMLCAVASVCLASSHREAPAITETPKLDATDFYLFKSYEGGREDFVTLIANYLPLQDPYGGPNYFALDPDALYEIKVDNNGDAVEDITFRFDFAIEGKDLSLQIGPKGSTQTVAVPLINIGSIDESNTTLLNRIETYKVVVIRGAGPFRQLKAIFNADTDEDTFIKPVDNIGLKSIKDYASYAAAHIYNIAIPGCGTPGRMFVGQRKDPFVVNLGEVFDLVNIANPLGDPDAETDDLADKNVTSLVLEIPTSCLRAGNNPVIGAWTTASLPSGEATGEGPFGGSLLLRRLRAGARVRQVSRLSSPLVNEVVIGLKDKDKFNASNPKDDAQFAKYVTHPTLPALLEMLFGGAGVRAPTLFPRTDLIQAFLTGLPGLNQPMVSNLVPAEMLRLNTTTEVTPQGKQQNLGALGGDFAGFPNGRRPGDDVVDIELRVAMGALLVPSKDAPSGALPFTDGAHVDDSFFDSEFPYLRTPIPGSPSETKR